MDFLKKIVCDGGVSDGRCLKQEPVDEEENVELSLGLSLNGRFGVERRRLVINNDYNNRLIRASSAVNLPLLTEDETTLTRTCSLPIASEEWKKRKELQSLRRSEAKRKRAEKLKNGKVVKGLVGEENCEMKKGKLIHGNDLLPPLPLPRLSSVGSPASGGSSGVSDLETQPFSGINKDIESKSRASQQSIFHQISRSKSIASEKSSTQKMMNDSQWKTMLSDMPCVSTKVNGVNEKKIEGFLYRYRKGEQVRIVCVCHGSFLTPAEFVKHGGGGDVEHPLRHIVVNHSSL